MFENFKTIVFYELVAAPPAEATEAGYDPEVYGPYDKLSHARMALKLNRSIRWAARNGAVISCRKITRTFTEVEEVVDL